MSFKDIFKHGFLESYANTEITLQYTVFAISICILFSCIICIVYFFKSRKYFYSREFLISLLSISIVTTAIILTIQTSIVVSLGMVGALSIVRFRTAIKNPLDLVFLFWSISVGIICGAGIYYIALPLTLVLGIIILLSDSIPGRTMNRILVLDGKYPYNQQDLNEILKHNVKWWNVKTESIHNDEVNIIIEIRGVKNQRNLIDQIRKSGNFHDISVMIQEGIID